MKRAEAIVDGEDSQAAAADRVKAEAARAEAKAALEEAKRLKAEAEAKLASAESANGGDPGVEADSGSESK